MRHTSRLVLSRKSGIGFPADGAVLRVHRGFALLTAMWVMVVLLILVAGFAVMSHSELEVARNYDQRSSARWAAHTGIRRAQAEVLSLAAQEPYVALGGPEMTFDGSSDQSLLNGATYTGYLWDESGKLNINTASATELQVFFPSDVANNILAWRGASTPAAPGDTTAQGVGNSYYNSLSPPYNCKSAPFDTVNELLLVDGVTQAMLNTVETSGGFTLEDILTASSVDSNLSMTGARRVNVATASASQLTRPNGPFSAAQARAISAVRQRTTWTSPANLLTVPGINMTQSQLSTIYDQLTVTNATTISGLVNINSATQEVLTALDGMDATTAQTIVQHVANVGPFTDVGGLCTLGLSNQTLINVAGLFTARSSRFSAVITGQGADGMTQTTTCLMQDELSNGSAIIRTLYWHE